MSCLPGMNCNDPIVYSVYPEGCAAKKFAGYPISSDLIYYSGPNLPNSGVNTLDCLTVALQKIDQELNPTVLVENILGTIINDPSLKAAFCNVVNQCLV